MWRIIPVLARICIVFWTLDFLSHKASRGASFKVIGEAPEVLKMWNNKTGSGLTWWKVESHDSFDLALGVLVEAGDRKSKKQHFPARSAHAFGLDYIDGSF